MIQWSAPTGCWRLGSFPCSGWTQSLPRDRQVAKDLGRFRDREAPLRVWCPSVRARDKPLIESTLQTSHGHLILVIDGGEDSVLGSVTPLAGLKRFLRPRPGSLLDRPPP